MAAAGMSNVDIGHKVQINTIEIVDRYLDLTRHLHRLHGLAPKSHNEYIFALPVSYSYPHCTN